MYLAIKHGAPAPRELLYWHMAEQFGWTMEYILSLPVSLLHEYIQIEDGRSKARAR